MSNDWNAPTPPQNTPPAAPAGGAASPPPPGATAEPLAIEPEPVAKKSRSTGKIVAAIVTVAVVGGAGVFAATKMAGSDDEATGAETPDELGQLTLDAFDQTDVLGAMDLLLPTERETYGEPLLELVDELERIEVLSEVDMSDINGVDVELANREVTVDEVAGIDDLVHITLSADATAKVTGAEVPTGPVLEENDIEAEDEVSEADETEPFEVPLVGVQRDGKWYLSMMYTVAEAARTSAEDPDTGEAPEIPATGVAPHGADSPEGAVDLMADAAESLDLEAIIAGLNPREAEALQRYAPIFLDEAQEEFDDTESTVQFTEIDKRVEGSGDTRHVLIEDIGVKVDTQGEVVDILWSDGCLKVEAEDDSIDFCDIEESTGIDTDEILEDFYAEFDDPEPVKNFIEAFTEAFADYEEPGITVVEVDGEWYVSPVATGTDHVLALFNAIDSAELRKLIDLGNDAAESFDDEGTVDFGD